MQKKKKNRKTKNDYRLIYVYMNEQIIKEKKKEFKNGIKDQLDCFQKKTKNLETFVFI